jgi:GT2 family glycosyltransferase
MENLIDLAIQIVNFNTKSYLINCLRSVFQDLSESELSFEINILENGSNDNLSDLFDYFSELESGKMKVIKSNDNLGFGTGHNMLAKETEAQYLLILNPDIVIQEKNSIEKLYQKINSDCTVKIIGPKLYNKKGKDQAWDHGEYNRLMNEVGLGYWHSCDQELSCTWVSGAVFLIEKKIFDVIDGFDQKFFLYKEEEDLCLRLKELNKNFKVLYYPEVRVLHFGSVVAKRSEYFSISKQYFMQKHRFGMRQL